jgi:hypothetical protein
VEVLLTANGFAPEALELPPGQYPGRPKVLPHEKLNSEQKFPVAVTDTVIAQRLVVGHKDAGEVVVPGGGLHAVCRVYPEGDEMVPALSQPHSACEVTVRLLAGWPLPTKSFTAAC